MKNSELIEKLTLIKEQSNSDFIDYTLTHAIKCVELMPELVSDLDFYYTNLTHYPVKKTEELIKKSKELIE